MRGPVRCGPGVPMQPGVGMGYRIGTPRPLSFYPFESTLNGQDEDHALSHFSNILELITCHLIRHKSAEMPPKVPVRFFLFDGDLVFLTRLATRTRSSFIDA